MYEVIVPLLSIAVSGTEPKADMTLTGLLENEKNDQRFRKPSVKTD